MKNNSTKFAKKSSSFGDIKLASALSKQKAEIMTTKIKNTNPHHKIGEMTGLVQRPNQEKTTK